MKQLLIIFVLSIFTINSVLAQKNELIIQVHNISVYNSKEEIQIDELELIQMPTETDKNIAYDFDLIFAHQFKKVNFLFGVGFSEIRQSGNDVLVRDSYYISRRITSDKKGFKIKTGIQCPFGISPNSNFYITPRITLGYNNTYHFSNDYFYENFDEQDNYLSGSRNLYDYSKSWKVELGVGIVCTYYVFKKIGIGLNLNSSLFYNHIDGISEIIRESYDDQKNRTDNLTIHQKERKKLFGKTGAYLSMNLSYKF